MVGFFYGLKLLEYHPTRVSEKLFGGMVICVGVRQPKVFRRDGRGDGSNTLTNNYQNKFGIKKILLYFYILKFKDMKKINFTKQHFYNLLGIIYVVGLIFWYIYTLDL